MFPRASGSSNDSSRVFVGRALALLEVGMSYGARDIGSELRDQLIHHCLVNRSGALLLDLIDLMLSEAWRPSQGWSARGTHSEASRSLRQLLLDGGSAWTVGALAPNRSNLVRRVDGTLQRVADGEMARRDRAAEHLRAAWAAAFGRGPAPSSAYDEAVKAVESALKPTVTPNDDAATLGRMIGVLRQDPSAWIVRLRPRPPRGQAPVDAVGAFIAQAQLLWQSQVRHGTDDPSVPLRLGIEEAQDAVVLAVYIVQMCTSGAFRRASPP